MIYRYSAETVGRLAWPCRGGFGRMFTMRTGAGLS
jgi:hypothetical protein